MSVRLSVGRLLDEAGLEDVRRDGGLYVALWRGGADAWRHEQAMRPLTPQALGSRALVVAMHPEGAELVFGTDRLLLAGDGVVLVPTSSSYRLESPGDDPRLLVVVDTRLDLDADPQGSEPHAVPVGGDEEAGHDFDAAREAQPTEEEQEQDQPEAAEEEVDVQAHVAPALTRIMAAAGPPPTTQALEEEDQRRMRDGAQDAMEQDEEPEFVGANEAHEVGPQELRVADKAGPKTGEVETCRHWAKGWCMRADACRYAHPQPPVPQGVPKDPPSHGSCGGPQPEPEPEPQPEPRDAVRDVVAKAQGGGLPTVGYAVACEGRTEWAVALPCGMAALLTPFSVVPWRDMVAVEAALPAEAHRGRAYHSPLEVQRRASVATESTKVQGLQVGEADREHRHTGAVPRSGVPAPLRPSTTRDTLCRVASEAAGLLLEDCAAGALGRAAA